VALLATLKHEVAGSKYVTFARPCTVPPGPACTFAVIDPLTTALALHDVYGGGDRNPTVDCTCNNPENVPKKLTLAGPEPPLL
jgi:hypothetical protein